jgi:pimeloyl-ACP methyl ester carboxylesterase
MERSTILFVHGAWGGAWSFKEADGLLSVEGFHVYRPTLTGLGERAHLASADIGLDTHIQDIVNVFLFENLRDVILVGHSYGGIIISGVAEQIPDRIRKMIYWDAFVPGNGECAQELRPPGIGFEVRDGFAYPNWDTSPTPPMDVPQSNKTFTDRISIANPATAKIPAAYVLMLRDKPMAEEARFFKFFQRAKTRGWQAITMEGDHNVMRSNPKGFVQTLIKLLP